MRLAWFFVALPLPLLSLPVAAQETPEAAALAYATAFRDGRWLAAARLMHPHALQQLRAAAQVLEGDQVRERLFGVRSATETAAMSDTVLFAAFLKAVGSRTAAMRTATFEPLGSLPQGKDTAVVVLRVAGEIQGQLFSAYEVMPFLRSGSVWRALLKSDLLNAIAALTGGRSSPPR
jgi:hypothetical protein